MLVTSVGISGALDIAWQSRTSSGCLVPLTAIDEDRCLKSTLRSPPLFLARMQTVSKSLAWKTCGEQVLFLAVHDPHMYDSQKTKGARGNGDVDPGNGLSSGR